MRKYHCIAHGGRMILGRFYRFGETIEFPDELEDLALSHQKAGVISQGEYRGESVDLGKEEDGMSDGSEDNDSGNDSVKKKHKRSLA